MFKNTIKRHRMDSIINKTNPVWQYTVDALQYELEQARDMPAWAIAVLVLSSVSTLCTFLICGVACGMILQGRSVGSRGVESERGLLSSDAAAQQTEDLSTYDVEPSSTPPPAKNKRKAQNSNRAKCEASVDDMEL